MRARARLCIELGEVKPRWDQWCARQGLTPAEGVRQLILDAVLDDAAQPDAAPESPMPWTVVGEHRKHVAIRLTSTELTAVKQRAAALGFNANRWIVALIRAHLTGEPQFGEQEMMLLATSNRQLASIGRLLGCIARDGARVAAHTELIDPQQLAAMKKELDAHLRAVAALVRANLDRWSR
ncbi:plasmid stabilization protein [Caballeronia mineralivorans PML1(12)]|uniref:Plasmid stabilization protein n=1 Tax=Caballeronia mineralivorans PML1(12) TaxID=908627 RepID=A0A0J1CIY9_9BURK|nr:plasmid stabilization protein [Caballeronia mineralivorans]KLU20655.1 plasmid stabilization protein [Caballeronia mineralivorans PML1(12)]